MTNDLPGLFQAASSSAPAWYAQFNAWHLVALGIGAFLAHGYHVVVQAGGYVMILKRFKWGPSGQPMVPSAAGAAPVHGTILAHTPPVAQPLQVHAVPTHAPAPAASGASPLANKPVSGTAQTNEKV